MPSGYSVSGRGDLDSLFMKRASTARANVGYQVGGIDIADRYEKIGGTTPIAATGFKSGGTDLASLFAGVNAVALAANYAVNAIGPEVGHVARITFASSTNSNIYGSDRYNGVENLLGTWCSTFPVGTSYDIRWTVLSGDAPNQSSGTAGTWVSLATGGGVYFQTAAASNNTRQCVGTIEIRSALSLSVVASTQVTLTARHPA